MEVYNPSSRFYGYAFLIAGIIIVNILILIVSIAGPMTTWFENLNKGSVSVWLILGLWIFATLLSYLGLILLYELMPCQGPGLVVAFLIGALVNLVWVTIFYYSENLAVSLWLSSILFIYMFWVFIAMWYIDPVPAIFLIPLLAVDIYIFYAVAHLATINDVVL